VERLVFHIDMDAFFAAIEQSENPELRGKPVIVGGGASGTGRRGVVSTCSYEARAFGVRSAMPMVQARRLCPNGIYVDVDMEKYAERSREIFHVLRAFTPMVEPRSIDEAFLDMTATAERFGGALAAGRKIKDAIRRALDLPATIGIAPNKLLAKLISGRAKPDGLAQLLPGDVAAYIESLPTQELWGIGAKTAESLARLGIRTVGELGRASSADLGKRMGVVGERLVLMGQGRDDAPVVPDYESPPPKSIGHERTMWQDLVDWDSTERELLALADRVGRRLRIAGFLGRTVAAKIRDASFHTVTRQVTLAAPTNDERSIFRAACDLVAAYAWESARPAAGARPRAPIRLLGVSVAGLVSNEDAPLVDLFAEDARASGETAVRDAIRDRFGDGALVRARLLARERARKPAPAPERGADRGAGHKPLRDTR